MNTSSNQANTPAAPAAAPAPADNGTGVTYESNYEARAASVFGNDSDASPQAAGEASDGSTPASPTVDASAAASVDVDAARRQRLAALAELRKKETATVDAKTRQKEGDELRSQLAAANKRAEEAERMASLRIDPEKLDERSFFETAAKAKVTPQRLGEWLREQQANPELAAARAVDGALDPKLAPLRAELDETKAKLQAFLDSQQHSQIEAEERAAFQHFASYTAQNAVTSPRSAAFLEKFGPEQFQKLANTAAASVHEGAGPQAVLDQIEENLAALAVIYAPSGATAKPPSTPNQNPAAAKAMTTVSNTLAQQRASVVDEDAEWASLPFEERSARLFR